MRMVRDGRLAVALLWAAALAGRAAAQPLCGSRWHEGHPGPDVVWVDSAAGAKAQGDGWVERPLAEGPGWSLRYRRAGWFGKALEVQVVTAGGAPGPALTFTADGARAWSTSAGRVTLRVRDLDGSAGIEVFGPRDGLPASVALDGLQEGAGARPIDRVRDPAADPRSREGYLDGQSGIRDATGCRGPAEASDDRVEWDGGRFALHRYYFPEGGSFDEAGYLLLDRTRRTWNTVHWFYTAMAYDAAGLLDGDLLALYRDRATLEVDRDGLRAFPLTMHLEVFRLGPGGLTRLGFPESDVGARLAEWLARQAAELGPEQDGPRRVELVPARVRQAGEGYDLALDLELRYLATGRVESWRAVARVGSGQLVDFRVEPARAM